MNRAWEVLIYAWLAVLMLVVTACFVVAFYTRFIKDPDCVTLHNHTMCDQEIHLDAY